MEARSFSPKPFSTLIRPLNFRVGLLFISYKEHTMVNPHGPYGPCR